MSTDIVERLEKIGIEMLALAAELKADTRHELSFGMKANEFPHEVCDREDCEVAIELIRKTKRASITHLQRQLGWGYNHASKIIDRLEERGIVGPNAGPGSREVFYDKMPPVHATQKDNVPTEVPTVY